MPIVPALTAVRSFRAYFLLIAVNLALAVAVVIVYGPQRLARPSAGR